MQTKRILDIIIASCGITFFAPLLIPIVILIWIQDFHSPIYKAPRVGKGGKLFNILKLRSMVYKADEMGVDSTSNKDQRITTIGHFIRRFKLDEIPQLFNVLQGTMSLVGPRPNVQNETQMYTEEEKKLLTVRPGITDIASIVFSDEGAILSQSEDPDLDYNRLIRPWKSRLGILYVENQSCLLDFQLLFLTALSLISKQKSLYYIKYILIALNADSKLIEVSGRAMPLFPFPPPGSSEIVFSRKISN